MTYAERLPNRGQKAAVLFIITVGKYTLPPSSFIPGEGRIIGNAV
jgi:hypothetical protein